MRCNPKTFSIRLPVCAILALGHLAFLYADQSQQVTWKEVKSKHFIVHFTSVKKSSAHQIKRFAKEVSNKSEIYYKRIALDLGYPRHEQFWLWDSRVKIYIYKNHISFLKGTDQPEWSHGMADYTNKQIASYLFSKGFLDSMLPHEIAHLIFRDFVGFKSKIPLWLDEGVAQWAEIDRKQTLKSTARYLFDKDLFIVLTELMKLDIRKIKESDGLHVCTYMCKKTSDHQRSKLTNNQIVDIFYTQSASLVDFLIEKYGSKRFASFCRLLKDGKALENALKSAYPVHIRNFDELEDKWLKYIGSYEGQTENKVQELLKSF